MNPVILVSKILILCLLYVVSHAEGEICSSWKGEEKQICVQSIEIHNKTNSMSINHHEVCQIIL